MGFFSKPIKTEDGVPYRGPVVVEQTCPVCQGRGFVPSGFYGPQVGTGSPACRRCDGRGTFVPRAFG